jgi:hypothetical protein
MPQALAREVDRINLTDVIPAVTPARPHRLCHLSEPGDNGNLSPSPQRGEGWGEGALTPAQHNRTDIIPAVTPARLHRLLPQSDDFFSCLSNRPPFSHCGFSGDRYSGFAESGSAPNYRLNIS